MSAVLLGQTPTANRLAAGRVMRPSQSGRPVPVPGQSVVLHRVGSDRAGPLDSTKSSADGRFRFTYVPSGAPDALYFVSSRYNGIAYFSPPLRSDTVRGGDADIIVYDTTTDAAQLRMQGRHLVLSQPRGSRREVAEIFEVDNEGTRTIVSRDSMTPIWSARLPAEAESTSVAPGDVTAGAVVFRGGRAEVYAPISPGVRQLALTYLLPVKAFPLSQPIERPVSVLEVLLEEPRANVEGARLSEVAPVTIEGRTFRRFLAQDVPENNVMRVSAPPPVGQNRGAMRVLAVIVAVIMLAAFAVWYAKRKGRPTSHIPHPISDVERLVAEVAALDARFDREPGDAQARAKYEGERAILKDRIAHALAEENQPA